MASNQIVKEFTFKCVNYLNKRYGKYAIFETRTKSKTPEILVRNKYPSYIIRPMLPGMQCAKINVSVDASDRSFIISNSGNSQTHKLSKILTNNYDILCEGDYLNLLDAQDVFFKWISIEYSESRVRYIITKNYELIPVENLIDCAKIICRYNDRKGTVVFYMSLAPNAKGLSIKEFVYSFF